MLFNYLIGNSLNKDGNENKIGNKKTFSKKSILIFGEVT
jgi:alginate O-acetyltransferase complex protein AlgI